MVDFSNDNASFAGSSPTRGGKLVADARNQQPFEPGEWGPRVVLSGHFCASLHVGHARRIRPVFNYRITDLEAQIKTKKQTNNEKMRSLQMHTMSVFGFSSPEISK